MMEPGDEKLRRDEELHWTPGDEETRSVTVWQLRELWLCGYRQAESEALMDAADLIASGGQVAPVNAKGCPVINFGKALAKRRAGEAARRAAEMTFAGGVR